MQKVELPRVKLVLENPEKWTRPMKLPQGVHNPSLMREQMDICDLIQGEMNGGFAIGVTRHSPDRRIILCDSVRSDGVNVSFGDYGENYRTRGCTPSEYIKRYIPLQNRMEHSHLVALARERGYCVELVE